MTRRGELNTTWTLPSNAVLTLSEKDEIAKLAARVLGDEWVACGFGDSPPPMSSAVVRIVFQAMKDILTRQGRLVPTTEAEDIVVAVEAGYGEHYGISKARYAEALLTLQEEEAK